MTGTLYFCVNMKQTVSTQVSYLAGRRHSEKHFIWLKARANVEIEKKKKNKINQMWDLDVLRNKHPMKNF